MAPRTHSIEQARIAPERLPSALCSALLRVEATHFVAASLWEKRLGKWICTKAAPIMRWHLTATHESVKQWLENKGYAYQWLKPNDPDQATARK